jgi:hypothetical protein
MRLGDGDLTIAWARAHDAEMIEHIQALMDRGVTFHRIETKETGKIRERVMDDPIASTGEIGQESNPLIASRVSGQH